MLNPTKLSLENNRTTLVLYVMLMLMGIASYFNIGRLEYPEITIRSAQVITQYPGRSSIEVEQEVTNALEQAIRQMPEVDTIASTSKPDLSILSVSIKSTYNDLDRVWQDMRNIVNETRLPRGAIKPLVNDSFGDVFPYVYALRSDGFSAAQMLDYAEDIRDVLLATDGVGKVELHGVQDEYIYLDFSSSELAAKGISPSQLAQQLSQQNAIASSGSVRAGQERLNLVTLGEFKTLQELADYRIAIPGESGSLRVSDLVRVRRGYVEPAKSRTHFNGERVICLAVSMVSGEAVTEVGERIEKVMEGMEAELPLGLDIETMFYQPEYVEQSIRNFIVNLGQAFFFVILVMFLFAGMRLALIVAILIPSTILMSFALMPSFDVELEMMSIAALIIALGLLVDNAVVVSEQVLVRLGKGQDRKTAVIKAGKGLMIPLLAASATTIAAFSPVALAEGGSSEFTRSLFVVVSLSLLSSWLLSMTIIPMACYSFLKPLKRDTFIGRQLARCYDPYERLLRFALRMRWFYPVLILALTVLAGMAFKMVPSIFFPPNERGQFVINFELPIGTDIVETERQVSELEGWLLEANADRVQSVSTWIGNGGPRWYLALSPEAANPNYALFSVITKTEDPAALNSFLQTISAYCEDAFPDARVQPQALENGPAVGDPIQIRLYGKDLDTLYGLRDRMLETIQTVSGLHSLRDSWGAWIKQVEIDPDPVRSARLGLSTDAIAESLNLQFSGLTVTSFREADKSIPVRLRAQDDFRAQPERLRDVPIFDGVSSFVPLGQVADVRVRFQPGSIIRENTERTMTIKGRVHGRYASEVLQDIVPLLNDLTESGEWPRGYRIEYGGEIEESSESQKNLAAVMPLAMAMLSLILIVQFNSLRRFAIIMLTIPPMLVGVTPGLLLTGSSFGFMTLLGMIALLGIIVNNAILLIDEINQQLEGELALTEAIIAACRSRLRPILLTTCTTIIGLLPLALGGGGMWSSMAFAMMFGLGFATALTLMLCPVLFYLFFRRSYPEDPASLQG
jgi:multidrug efflux pump subunit AcrB